MNPALQELAGTTFSKNYLHNDNAILEFRWINQHQEMSADDFKEALLVYVDLVRKYQPKAVLADTSQLSFAIAPDVQAWVDENIHTITNKILRKLAVIVPQSFIERLSVEQVLEEKEGIKMTSRFFDNYEKALAWLQS